MHVDVCFCILGRLADMIDWQIFLLSDRLQEN